MPRLIEHIPLNSTLLFVGLGEPTLPLGQKNIIEVLSTRSDIKGYIQSNGSHKLSTELIAFIENNQLTIGVSYDLHHNRGGRTSINIQGEYVDAISIAVEKNMDYLFADINRLHLQFPKLNRILLDPLMSDDERPLIDWSDMKNFALRLSSQINIPIYTQIADTWEHGISEQVQYYRDCMRDCKEITKNWHIYDNKFAINVASPHKEMRILSNGKLLLDAHYTSKSWKFFEENPHLISEMECLKLGKIEAINSE
ncbi:MAG: hypothetical protein ACMXYC_00050 [Candidatus Woesearchaeota archaeon]